MRKSSEVSRNVREIRGVLIWFPMAVFLCHSMILASHMLGFLLWLWLWHPHQWPLLVYWSVKPLLLSMAPSILRPPLQMKHTLTVTSPSLSLEVPRREPQTSVALQDPFVPLKPCMEFLHFTEFNHQLEVGPWPPWTTASLC